MKREFIIYAYATSVQSGEVTLIRVGSCSADVAPFQKVDVSEFLNYLKGELKLSSVDLFFTVPAEVLRGNSEQTN